MGPINALAQAFAKIFTYRGRASRSEYWWYFLFATIIGIVCMVVDVMMVLALVTAQGEAAIFGLGPMDFASTWSWIVTMPAFLSLTVRRLHDAGFSGFWLLLYIVPLGAFALMIMHMLPSQGRTTIHGTPATAPQVDRTGTPITADAHQRAMQGYALLFDMDKQVTPEQQAARKTEISEYYRNRVLKSAPSA